MNSGVLQWLQTWCEAQADGEWEHCYGVKIETVDNPGWWITIELTDTVFENIDHVVPITKVSATDWYFYRFAKKKFEASGDLTKLEFLLGRFREKIEAYQQQVEAGPEGEAST